jgi:hypothetical protein
LNLALAMRLPTSAALIADVPLAPQGQLTVDSLRLAGRGFLQVARARHAAIGYTYYLARAVLLAINTTAGP